MRGPYAALVLALSVLVAACSGGTASPSPGGFREVFESLARRGATVTQIVSGDPGCADRSLVANAVRFTLQIGDGALREVHLFGFRDAAALDAARPRLDECLREFAARKPPAEAPGTVRLSPFYAFGSPWSESAGSLLSAALDEAVKGT